MSDTRISAFNTLGETFSIIWREKQLFILLIAFLSIVSLIFLWPILDWYVALLTDFSVSSELDPATTRQIIDNTGYVFIWYIPFIYFILAPLVLWSRASIGGTGIALEGGFMALLKRTLWVLWRYVCFIGWVLLFTLGFVVVFYLVGIVTGISSANGDLSLSATAWFFIILGYIVFLIAIIALTFLYSVSLHCEARDFRLPIHKSFIAMKGNLVRATGALLAAIVVFYVVYILFTSVFIGAIVAASTWMTIIGLFFLFALGNIYNFIWISYGALYAAKLVPELKG